MAEFIVEIFRIAHDKTRCRAYYFKRPLHRLTEEAVSAADLWIVSCSNADSSKTWKAGVNQWTGLTREEFSKVRLRLFVSTINWPQPTVLDKPHRCVLALMGRQLCGLSSEKGVY